MSLSFSMLVALIGMFIFWPRLLIPEDEVERIKREARCPHQNVSKTANTRKEFMCLDCGEWIKWR